MKSVLAGIVLLTGIAAQAATQADDRFCQGTAMLAGHLQQQLQGGQTRTQAIEQVLEATGAPEDRAGLRQFLDRLADLMQLIDLPASASPSFIYLSCNQAGLFGDSAAQAAYRQQLPALIEAARLCAAAHAGGEALQRCLSQAFILPAGGR